MNFSLKLGEDGVGLVDRILGNLVAGGGGPLVPETGAEDAEAGDLAEGAGVAVLAVAVELCRYRTFAFRRGRSWLGRTTPVFGVRALVLLVVVTVGVLLGVEMPDEPSGVR